MSKYLVVESPIHGQDVLLVFTKGSSNIKTGDMVQVGILHPDMDPVTASRTGADERVCGTCPLRHHTGGACYVTLFQGPGSAYKGWVNSGRRIDSAEDILEICKGKKIRWGFYGDPGHIPAWLVGEVCSVAAGWTAYLHTWRNPVVAKTWLGRGQASCDTPSQLRLAESQGWHGFVVTDEQLHNVTLCDNEENGTQCIDCLRCNGSSGSVRIAPHGARQNKHPARKGK